MWWLLVIKISAHIDSAARKDADDLVAALNKLAQDLDEIEEAIKEQSSAPVQTEPEFIQKVENKHEVHVDF